MKTEIAKSIREKRIVIDEILEQSKAMVHSDCTLDARKSLRRSSSWLGKSLQALQTENPYPESMNKNSKVIEKRADTAPSVDDLTHLSPLALVKHFRKEVEELIQWVNAMKITNSNFIPELRFAYDQVYISLVDSKMDLGWELNRMNNLPAKDRKMISELSIEELTKTKTGKKWTTENWV